MHDGWLRGAKGRWVRREGTDDRDAIRTVNIEAFGQGNEANLVDTLREESATFLSFVAGEGDQVLGHLLLSCASLVSPKGSQEILTLAPMAVLPRYQGCGIGSALVHASLEAAKGEGYAVVTVLGHPTYYPRFGFVPAAPLGVCCEYEVPEEAFMILELTSGGLQGLSGTVEYPAAFRAAL